MRFKDEFRIRMEGHVRIVEYATDDAFVARKPTRTVMSKRNAIHPEHASILIARGIANRANGAIYSMHFGTGGATIDPLGTVVFATPNTEGSADLNTPVYFEVVDDTNGAPSGNSMAVRHVNGSLFSDVEIRCVLGKNEPFGQPAFDNVGAANVNTDTFTFDEIGLKTEDDLLVTHVVFTPVQKTANRIWEVIYNLRVRMT